MATTPIYGFTTPELGSTADGPAAMAALAARVERQMTTIRVGTEFSQEPNANYGPNTNNNLIHSISFPTSIIGWLEIHATINLGAYGASGTNIPANSFSGFIYLLVDDGQRRKIRFHTLWGTRTVQVNAFCTASRTAAQTTTSVKLRMDVGSDLGVTVNSSNIYVGQVGAPATG